MINLWAAPPAWGIYTYHDTSNTMVLFCTHFLKGFGFGRNKHFQTRRRYVPSPNNCSYGVTNGSVNANHRIFAEFTQCRMTTNHYVPGHDGTRSFVLKCNQYLRVPLTLRQHVVQWIDRYHSLRLRFSATKRCLLDMGPTAVHSCQKPRWNAGIWTAVWWPLWKVTVAQSGRWRSASEVFSAAQRIAPSNGGVRGAWCSSKVSPDIRALLGVSVNRCFWAMSYFSQRSTHEFLRWSMCRSLSVLTHWILMSGWLS